MMHSERSSRMLSGMSDEKKGANHASMKSGKMNGMHMKKMQRGIELLDSAIALHEAHMNGGEPTDDASQKQLMQILQQSREVFSGMGEMREKSESGEMEMS